MLQEVEYLNDYLEREKNCADGQVKGIISHSEFWTFCRLKITIVNYEQSSLQFTNIR